MELQPFTFSDNASGIVDITTRVASLHASWDHGRMGEYAATLEVEMANSVADMFRGYEVKRVQ